LVAKEHIRRANTGDAQTLSDLSKVTFIHTFKDTCTADDMQGFVQEHFNIELIKKELLDPVDFYFIAFINGIAAGYIRMKEDTCDVEIIAKHKAIELKRIYVLEEYHGQKTGAALMNFALDFAGDKGYEIIWLGVWEHNNRAKRFYRKFDFKDTGVTHPFPIGNTPQTDTWLYRFIKP
jgi:ribosomal protein S18 acetylase RimI-like enzyme